MMTQIIKTIFLIFFVLVIYTTSGQVMQDDWYVIENKAVVGYMHLLIEEDSLSIQSTVDVRYKIDSTILYYNAIILHEKDSLLSVKSFVLQGTTDDVPNPEEFNFSGTITTDKEHSVWAIQELELSKITKQPTIVFWNLFYILTTLDYSIPGRILDFNSMELSEFNYKENHYLDYVGVEKLVVKEQEIDVRKIIHKGEGIGESTYWLDMENNVVLISIDNQKNFVKCIKNEVNFELFR